MKTVFTGPKSLVVPRASSTRRSRWMTPVSPRAIAEIKMRAALRIEEMAGRSRRQRQLAQHLACRRCDAQDRLGTAALMDFLADGAPMRGEAEHADGLCGGSFFLAIPAGSVGQHDADRALPDVGGEDRRAREFDPKALTKSFLRPGAGGGTRSGQRAPAMVLSHAWTMAVSRAWRTG
jgi:hypothetical protein